MGQLWSRHAIPVSSPKSKLPLPSSAAEGSWSAVPEHGPSNTITYTILSPPTASIGRYDLSVQISSSIKNSTIKLGQFILLFNPWCADDDVFMPIDAERKEYVLNDSGIIYRGHKKYITELGWNFGQFEKKVLDLCLTILDKSLEHCKEPSVDCTQRNNPVYVSRVISAMVNCQDDDGVLEGNWSGDYSDGTDPGSWNGSVAILQEWGQNNYSPVEYGQCWVFAGVTCTVLRCLGIPARVVTNFSSAHDTNGNLSIDEFYDKTGKPLNKSDDSIWNFHVWNEGWFARKDLGTNYDGWQVLDATPQEQSTGIYRCGPTSVKAIKEGDVDLDYDAPFVFAEVNADRVSWICEDDNKKERLCCDSSVVGKNISTKSVGQNLREDITASYKYEEGSEKEREVFTKAFNKLFGSAHPSTSKQGATGDAVGDASVLAKIDVSGKFKIIQSVHFGEDANLILILKNSSTKRAKNVVVSISASSMLYNGRVMSEVSGEKTSVTLGPSEEKEIPFTVTYGQYDKYLSKDDYNVHFNAVCEAEGEAKFLVQKTVTLEHPPINLKVFGPVVVNKLGKAEVTFSNPLSEELTDGKLIIVGATLLNEALEKIVNSIKPKETITISFDISPTALGNKQLAVNFSCNKFCNVKTFVKVVVVEDKISC
ncbi:protein-glutamine gamma-glutamyltransferase E-like isoform X2 [Pleurodeles waltl]|uniref:protein-glutamine gamma-glutamyltransferase E-like isoform X2 n=1 Tax=Pleurodeles waltl TaxID=8319 RepID=UPI0037094D9B